MRCVYYCSLEVLLASLVVLAIRLAFSLHCNTHTHTHTHTHTLSLSLSFFLLLSPCLFFLLTQALQISINKSLSKAFEVLKPVLIFFFFFFFFFLPDHYISGRLFVQLGGSGKGKRGLPLFYSTTPLFNTALSSHFSAVTGQEMMACNASSSFASLVSLLA